MKSYDADCDICSEFNGRASRFGGMYGRNVRDRIVTSSKNFHVIPSLGQLGQGHLMIVSRKHDTAIANLSDDLRAELFVLGKTVQQWMHRERGPYVVAFENGDPAGKGLMACSISHLHLHLVSSQNPLDGLRAKLDSLGGRFIRGIGALSTQSQAYSVIEFGPDDAVLLDHRLSSQTLRRLVSEETGDLDWNWRNAGYEHRLVSLLVAARRELAPAQSSSYPRVA